MIKLYFGKQYKEDINHNISLSYKDGVYKIFHRYTEKMKMVHNEYKLDINDIDISLESFIATIITEKINDGEKVILLINDSLGNFVAAEDVYKALKKYIKEEKVGIKIITNEDKRWLNCISTNFQTI